MLFRLRHPAVIGCDDEEGQIHRSYARDHVFHEVLMARDVHDSEHERRGIWRGRRKLQVREAKINRDAARFFFRQAIGIRAGQSLHQRALAMVYVAGGGQDEMLHGGHSFFCSLFPILKAS